MYICAQMLLMKNFPPPLRSSVLTHDPTSTLPHHRRNVAGLPRLLRDPGSLDQPGHPDERGIRLRHHAEARAARSIRPNTSRSRSTAPPRRCGTTQYDLYKATRKKMPADLAQQIPYIRKFCEAMRIPTLVAPGYEADDIIATVTTRAVQRRPLSPSLLRSTRISTSLSTPS